MRYLFKLFIVILLFSCNKNEELKEQVAQDTLVSAFFGLDNVIPGLLCNQPGNLLDGMPVNFKFPLDASSLSETDFEVLDSFGNIHTPICVSFTAIDNSNPTLRETTVEDIPNIPGVSENGLLVGNFGLGISF